MIKTFVSSILAKNKNLLLHEAEKISGFMALLMKTKNTRQRWTREEKKLLRAHLWRLSWYIPVLIIFALPFGSLLFPVLAEMMDRRQNRQNRIHHPTGSNSANPAPEL
jgi:hypothetical protein